MAVRLRLFAAARQAAGRATDDYDVTGDDDATLGGLLDRARTRYGTDFADVLATARVWVNGDDPTDGENTVLHDDDEVAVLPPVSGG